MARKARPVHAAFDRRPGTPVVPPDPVIQTRAVRVIAGGAKLAAVLLMLGGAMLGLREAASAYVSSDRAVAAAALSPREIVATTRSDLARKGSRLAEQGPPVVEASVAPPPARAVANLPEAVCAAISMGAAPAAWEPSAMFDGEWECLDATAEARDAGAIFGMARGSGEGRLDYVRLKLSLGRRDAISDIRLFGEIAQTVVSLAGNTLPPAIGEALATLSPAQFSDDRVKYTFMPEKMDPSRFNLVIQFLRAGTG